MTPLCSRTAARNREGIRAHPLTSWSRSPHRSLRDGVRPHGVACTRSRQTAAAKATKAVLAEPSSYLGGSCGSETLREIVELGTMLSPAGSLHLGLLPLFGTLITGEATLT